MSEFRQNPITKQWVLIAPARAKRPEDYSSRSVMKDLPELDPECVFCPGNEDKNPDMCIDVCRIPNDKNWDVRVIKNKYPALEHIKIYSNRDFYNSRAGYGESEVIITRKHNEPVALQSLATVEKTLEILIERINEAKGDPKVAYVQIFHNHGRDAGASLIHPHYQLFALPMVPPHIHSEIAGCQHYYNLNKKCIYCDIMKEELAHKDRVVYENDHFVVLSAYASRKPFETWILPKRHSARFEDMTAEERKHLAFVLKTVVGQLYIKLSDPPLNFYTHTLPFHRDAHTILEQDSYHWHLTVFPHVGLPWGGFEYAAGLPVNPMPPEMTAAFLRKK